MGQSFQGPRESECIPQGMGVGEADPLAAVDGYAGEEGEGGRGKKVPHSCLEFEGERTALLVQLLEPRHLLG